MGWERQGARHSCHPLVWRGGGGIHRPWLMENVGSNTQVRTHSGTTEGPIRSSTRGKFVGQIVSTVSVRPPNTFISTPKAPRIMAYIFMLLGQRANLPDTVINFSTDEYQQLCVAVNELPPEEQGGWDNTILNFTYLNKPIVLDSPPPAEQGEDQ